MNKTDGWWLTRNTLVTYFWLVLCLQAKRQSAMQRPTLCFITGWKQTASHFLWQIQRWWCDEGRCAKKDSDCEENQNSSHNWHASTWIKTVWSQNRNTPFWHTPRTYFRIFTSRLPLAIKEHEDFGLKLQVNEGAERRILFVFFWTPIRIKLVQWPSYLFRDKFYLFLCQSDNVQIVIILYWFFPWIHPEYEKVSLTIFH